MTRSLAIALALLAVVGSSSAALAQQPPPGQPQCADFLKLREAAEKKANAVRAATTKKADRKEVCTLVQRFTTAEGLVVKFLEDNKTWCGIPPEAIKQAKAGHEKTLKFRTMACAENQARPRQPTLSDAITTPSVDTAGNTQTGRGTLDTLNGNALAK